MVWADAFLKICPISPKLKHVSTQIQGSITKGGHKGDTSYVMVVKDDNVYSKP